MEGLRRDWEGLIQHIRGRAPSIAAAFRESWHLPVLIRNLLFGLLLEVAISSVWRVLGGPGQQTVWILVPPILGIAMWACTVLVAVIRHEGSQSTSQTVSEMGIQAPDEIAELMGSLNRIMQEVEGHRNERGQLRAPRTSARVFQE